MPIATSAFGTAADFSRIADRVRRAQDELLDTNSAIGKAGMAIAEALNAVGSQGDRAIVAMGVGDTSVEVSVTLREGLSYMLDDLTDHVEMNKIARAILDPQDGDSALFCYKLGAYDRPTDGQVWVPADGMLLGFNFGGDVPSFQRMIDRGEFLVPFDGGITWHDSVTIPFEG